MAVTNAQPISASRRSPEPAVRAVIAGSEEMRARIAASLAGWESRAALLDYPASLDEIETDESTILILVCDADLPRDIANLRRLRREAREAAIVAISPPATGAGVRRTLDAGADALVFEPDLEHALAATIAAVASGQSVVPRKLRASVERPTLSHRENQVMTLVGHGLTSAEIANRLFLAESTIKSHLASVFAKFGVHSRREAAAVYADLYQ